MESSGGPTEGEMIEELQKTVEELQELLRLKEERISELEGYTESLERQQEASDEHIKSLNETVSRQDELISEQQNFTTDTKKGTDEEILQLTEILEAQEAAMAEQRNIIEQQADLIAELNNHVLGDSDRPQSEGGVPALQRDLSGAALKVPSYPSGAGKGGSSRGPGADHTSKGPSRTVRSDPSSLPASRLSPREMLLKRPVGAANGAPVPQAPGGSGPPRPRPNSAFGKDAPRAKSWGAGGRDGSSREPEIVRRPAPKQPTTCTAQAATRGSSGRRYPPALPALERAT